MVFLETVAKSADNPPENDFYKNDFSKNAVRYNFPHRIGKPEEGFLKTLPVPTLGVCGSLPVFFNLKI